jgi:GNAT superfamily N-acetyltransferase
MVNLKKLQITRLSISHIDAKINTGDHEIDEFFEKVFEYEEEGIANVYVASIDGQCVGYYTLSNASVTGSIDGKQRKWPSILLGHLGVDKSFQRKGIGSELLKHALKIAKNEAKEGTTGCRLLYLETYKESLVEDYYIKRHNFILLRKDFIKSKKMNRFTLCKDLL